MWSDAPRSVGAVGATNRTVVVSVTVVVRICLANSHSAIGPDTSRSIDAINASGCVGRTRPPSPFATGTFPSDQMICWSVSARVGNVKNNEPSLIEAVTSS